MMNDEISEAGTAVLESRGIAKALDTHSRHLHQLLEGQRQIIELLTPKEKEGPGLEELLAYVVAQLNEVTNYVRQIVKTQSQMEQTLPGDVAKAVMSPALLADGANGRNGTKPS